MAAVYYDLSPIFCSSDEVGLVDYEYGGPNYLAFDIADHFCEHAGKGIISHNSC